MAIDTQRREFIEIITRLSPEAQTVIYQLAYIIHQLTSEQAAWAGELAAAGVCVEDIAEHFGVEVDDIGE